eukprot:TRINITY_DN3745_c0_g1_i1.p1 TRINITY_DN3745_c0_g1~~TRINITY_DN3745_c0_g1_i1.p1  ORF type:complete len:478 (+),score=112.90 TRINITY_DN3745_c0_g1_i1:48-1436(+)
MTVDDGPCWLQVRRLPLDATPRELHVLFSSCSGYVKSKLASDATSKDLVAAVQFISAEETIEALYSRNGTSWHPEADPVEIELWEGPLAAGQLGRTPAVPISKGARQRCSSFDDASSQCTDDSRSLGSPPRIKYMGSPSQRGYPSPGGAKRPSLSQRQSAQSMIDRAMESRRKGDLEVAIQMGREAGLAEEKLRAPMEALEVILIRTQARQHNASGGRKQVALSKLQESMMQLHADAPIDKKLKALKAAIQNAELAGLSLDAVEEAQAAHDEMEERVAALEHLERQTQRPTSATDLRSAIQRAKVAGVATDLLHRGARQLVDVEKKAKARQILQSAMEEQHKALLKASELRPGQQLSTNLVQVVEEVRRAGLDEEELQGALEAIEIERRFLALLRLEKAKEARSVPALQKAIKEALKVQADDDLIMQAEMVLQEEELKAQESRARLRPTFRPAGQSFGGTPA